MLGICPTAPVPQPQAVHRLLASSDPWVTGRTAAQVLQSIPEAKDSVPVASFHSISKGFYGECGRRGGYLELTNFPGAVLSQLGKLASISLCSNVAGQIAMAMVMKPPQVGGAACAAVHLLRRSSALGLAGWACAGLCPQVMGAPRTCCTSAGLRRNWAAGWLCQPSTCCCSC